MILVASGVQAGACFKPLLCESLPGRCWSTASSFSSLVHALLVLLKLSRVERVHMRVGFGSEVLLTLCDVAVRMVTCASLCTGNAYLAMPTRGSTDDRVLQIWLQVQTP